MGCCKKTCGCRASAEWTDAKIDELKMSAAGLGFDPAWVADFLQKYGPDILSLAIEAARLGLSQEFIMEVLQKFGPVVMAFLVDLLNKKNMQYHDATGKVVALDDNLNLLAVLLEKLMPVLIQNLPQIIQQYGPQILQAIIQAIMNSQQK